MPRLSDRELAEHLANLPGWQIAATELVRTFQFRDFREAMAFVNRIAEEAEARQHHPDIDIRYNKVLIMLTTHDAGGLTEKDTALAGAIDTFAAG